MPIWGFSNGFSRPPSLQAWNHTSSIQSCGNPQPTSAKSLERFLGLINFYHGFVPHAAEILKLLYQALSGKPCPKTITWTDEMDGAFTETKLALANATMLHHPVSNALTALTSDASDTAVGAVLEQGITGSWRPLAFFIWQLTKNRTKLRHFRPRIVGNTLGDETFPVFPRGPSVHHFHRSQTYFGGSKEDHETCIGSSG